jgi:hypothetical protein
MKLHNKPGEGKTLTYSLEVLRKSRQQYIWFLWSWTYKTPHFILDLHNSRTWNLFLSFSAGSIQHSYSLPPVRHKLTFWHLLVCLIASTPNNLCPSDAETPLCVSLCDGVLRWKKPSLYDMDMEKQSLHSNTESWTWMLIKECTHWRCWLLQGVHTAIPLSTPAPSQLRIFRSQLYTSTKEWEISVKAYNVCVKSVFATRGACYLCDKVVQKSTWNQGQVVQVES